MRLALRTPLRIRFDVARVVPVNRFHGICAVDCSHIAPPGRDPRPRRGRPYDGPTPDRPAGIVASLARPTRFGIIDVLPPSRRMMDDLNAACAEWIARIARRDDRALAELYDATIAHCYGLAMHITRSHDAAEDAVAETYLQVWRDAARYEATRGRPMAWLMMLTRSRALDVLRRARQAPLPTDACDEVLDADSSDGIDPSALVDAMEAHVRLHAAMAALPAAARQVLGLAFFRGLSHREIAQYTNMPLGTVKSHLRRAQAALREGLEDSE